MLMHQSEVMLMLFFLHPLVYIALIWALIAVGAIAGPRALPRTLRPAATNASLPWYSLVTIWIAVPMLAIAFVMVIIAFG